MFCQPLGPNTAHTYAYKIFITDTKISSFLTAVVRVSLGSRHMWESRVLLTDGQVVFSRGTPVFAHL